ncbi:ABC transporter substrate-binding protein [Companilactobacillus metriopterae]|uniref:ABC transporter substrate-binding protein n=1 Tax=Companilactobacillus metriopterae TaxID=1909267 RepID=UPI00100A2E7C|nr:ABC transporter substrate-binding protein [Companilactobacillus metriopterae]
MQKRKSYSKTIIFVFFLWLIGLGSIFSLNVLSKSTDNNKNDNDPVVTTYALVQMADTLHINLKGIPTTSYSIPKRYNGVTKVGSPMSPNMEKIKKLNANQVYAVTTLKDTLNEGFKSNGINVTYVDLQNIDSLKSSLNSMAKKYGKQKYADDYNAKLDRSVNKIKQDIKNNKPKKVLILFGMPGGSYLQATSNSYIGSLVSTTNNKVIESDTSGEYVSVNMEEVQKAKPDIVICLAHAMPDVVKKDFQTEFSSNQVWQQMPAFKNGKVFYLKEPLYSSTANMNVIRALNGINKIVNGK